MDEFAGATFKDLQDRIAAERRKAIPRDKHIEYSASRFAAPFHNDNTSRVKALMSCVGTGKSSTCIMELLRLGTLQPAAADGVRYSKTAVIRATRNQLENTTLATWQYWLPPKICSVKKGNQVKGHIRQELSDGTILDMEIVFMAMDSDQWLDNVQGLEITFFWINEFVELRAPAQILKAIMSRLGRYPAKSTAPIRWTGGLLDYNPPRINSYAYKLFEGPKKPASFNLYRYDAPLIMHPDPEDPDDFSLATFEPNPDADYAAFQNLGYQYWMNMIEDHGTDANYVRRMVLGEYTYMEDGNPIFTNFRQSKHVGATKPRRDRKLVIGLDAGLTPAAVLSQLMGGTLNIHEAIATTDCTFTELWEIYVEPILLERFKGYGIICALDKGSDNRGEVEGATVKKYLNGKGYQVWVCDDLAIQTRLDSVNSFLSRSDGMLIDPVHAEVLVQGMAGGYRWKSKRRESTYSEEKRTEPDKGNIFSHPMDALQAITMLIRSGSGFDDSREFWSMDSIGKKGRRSPKPQRTKPVETNYYYG
jgi:hypothetical protein